MGICFRIPSVLRRYTEGAGEVDLDADVSVAAVLEGLFARFPDLRVRVVDVRKGSLHPYLLLFRNEQTLPRTGLDAQPVEEGDVLDLVGLAGGGAPEERSGDVRMHGFARKMPVAEARRVFLGDLDRLEVETVPVTEVAGRVLAEAAVSEVAVPPFRRAAMDGYAVWAEDTFGASDLQPAELALVGEVLPGTPPETLPTVGPGRACRIMTGAPVPDSADAVLMAEYAEERDAPAGRVVLAKRPLTPGKHVARVGEDVDIGAVVLEAGRRLRPQDVAILAGIGMSPVPVVRRPRVRIVAAGNELLPPGEKPGAGRIVDSNTPMLRALTARDGTAPAETVRLPDDPERIEEALTAPGADVVLCIGGTSVGREDWLPVLVRRHGELLVHGVACRPASPTGLGRVGGARVVLLPGNPVSCLCAYDLFAGPLLRALGGLPQALPYRPVERTLARKVVSQIGRLDYVRIALGPDDAAEPIAISGASILSSVTRARGFALIPPGSEGLPAGARVTVYLYDAWSDAADPPALADHPA